MIALPEAENRWGDYAAAVVTGAAHQEAARWFVDYLCSQAGQAAYAAHGFGVPSS
jgi:ABC-type Fe3+ transport system substrate-binding protein